MTSCEKETKKILKRYNKVSWVELYNLYDFVIEFLIPRIKLFIDKAYKINTANKEKEDLQRLLNLMIALKTKMYLDKSYYPYLHSLIKNKKFPKDIDRKDILESTLLQYRCQEEFLTLLKQYFFNLWY